MLGIIGGSGIYELEGLSNAKWIDVDTPFGRPSDQLLVGELDGHQVAFLPRHGRGHLTPPSQLNVRANISALKQLGVTDLVSLSAVGSLNEELSPGMFVLVDQYIDWTRGRPTTFFSEGYVTHVSMAHPMCRRLSGITAGALRDAGGGSKIGGTYLCIEGPHFSSLAESKLYRQWGADVIGMTNCTEAKLAREAELCFSTIAMVTDWDCWHPGHDAVTALQVARVVAANAKHARDLVRRLIPLASGRTGDCSEGCSKVLDAAVMTAEAKRDATHLRALKAAGLRVEAPAASKDDPFELKPFIRTVHDFPKKGIAFRDVTTLVESPNGFRRAVKALAERYRTQKLDHVLGIDARGFIFGSALAYELGCGFIPVRKKGKLPGTTLKMEYALEYGTDAVELRDGCLKHNDKVVVVDDLIATGGTAEAAVKLAQKLGAKIHECAFVIELPDLKGRERLTKVGANTYSLVSFEGD